jgi:transcription elongation factor GreA
MKKTPISAAAHAELSARRDRLRSVEIPEAESRVVSAQNDGGDCEGLEAVEAVFDLERLRGDLARLERDLTSHEVVAPSQSSSVEVGVLVVFDAGDGPEEYRVDSVPGPGVLTPSSPLGKALLGRQAGARVEVPAPAGTYLVDLLEVRPA